jgi:hypothetical protein
MTMRLIRGNTISVVGGGIASPYIFNAADLGTARFGCKFTVEHPANGIRFQLMRIKCSWSALATGGSIRVSPYPLNPDESVPADGSGARELAGKSELNPTSTTWSTPTLQTAVAGGLATGSEYVWAGNIVSLNNTAGAFFLPLADVYCLRISNPGTGWSAGVFYIEDVSFWTFG